MAKLQDSKKNYIHYRFDKPPESARSILDLIDEWLKANEHLQVIAEPGAAWPVRGGEEEIIILPELTYFITLMNLFSNLV